MTTNTENKMQAFHNDPAIKEKFVLRMYAHRDADTLIQGTGWDGAKGCNIGCALETYDHNLYPSVVGLPVWLVHLQDKIFEGLSRGKGIAFAAAVFPAIKVGADVEKVRWQLAVARHTRDLARLDANNEPYAEQCKSAIRDVIAYCESQITGRATESAARAAESAARAAAHYEWEAATLLQLLSECE